MEALISTHKIRSMAIVNMLPIVVMVIYYYTHYIEGTYSFFIPLAATLFWILQSTIFRSNYSILFKKESVWWIVYYVVGLLMFVAGFSSTNLNFLISRLPFYIIPIIGFFVIRHYNIKEMRLFLLMFGIVFLGNLIHNILMSFSLPEIFEEMESTEYAIALGVTMNVATTPFIAVCLWMIGCCRMIIDNIKSKMTRIIVLALLLAMAYYITMINVRGTAMILLGIMIVGLVLAKFESKRSRNHSAYYIFTGISIAVVLFSLIIPILLWIMQNTESTRLTERLEDLISLKMSGGDKSNLSEGSLSARILFAQTSFGTFISNPLNMLIGIGDHTQSFGGDIVKSGIGGHSEFIDVLARNGILGAVVFWNILKGYYINTVSLSKDRNIIKYFNIIFFVFILYGFLNNVFQPVMQIFIFIILPIIIVVLNNSKQVKQ